VQPRDRNEMKKSTLVLAFFKRYLTRTPVLPHQINCEDIDIFTEKNAPKHRCRNGMQSVRRRGKIGHIANVFSK